MAHLQRRRTDAAWERGRPVTGADMAFIDENTYKALNGDDGGSWTPSGLVTIGGSGVGIVGPWELLDGAAVNLTLAPTVQLAFGKKTLDDAILLGEGHAERTRDMPRHTVEAFGADLSDVSVLTSDGFSLGCVTTRKAGVRFLTPIEVHDGATISYVRFAFRVGAHTELPERLTRFRVVRVAADGTVEPLKTPDGADSDSDGFSPYAPAPETAAEWPTFGVTRYYDYVVSQNGLVDLSRYAYFAEILDESGPGSEAGNFYISTTTRCSNISMLAGRE